MTASAIQATRARSPSWRNAGLAAAAAGLNVGAVGLLSLDVMGGGSTARSIPERPIYLDITPRPRLPDERPRQRPALPQTDRPAVAGAAPDAPLPRMPASSPMTEAATDGVAEAWRVRPSTAANPLPGLADCNPQTPLSLQARDLCRERRMRLTQGASPIPGTGDAQRDAAFARQGARRMAAWESQRAAPPRAGPACENPHPVAGCEGVNVQVELFSSLDGVLPNLRKRRQ